jgi:hypothetical protein
MCDLEFESRPGERPIPVCLVAQEWYSGTEIRLWRDQLGPRPPFEIGSRSLFVSYYAPAELGCFRALGWPTPARILDLFVEFRNLTNGLATVAGNSLLGALAHFGIDGIGATEKDEMRNLVLGGGPWTDSEQTAILDYCAEDVSALKRLLRSMLPHIDFPRALYRGRYMAAVSSMEHSGVPINAPLLSRLAERWDAIKSFLITRIDAQYGVFEGNTFKVGLFEQWLAKNNIPWPRLASGQLETSDDAFRSKSPK